MLCVRDRIFATGGMGCSHGPFTSFAEDAPREHGPVKQGSHFKHSYENQVVRAAEGFPAGTQSVCASSAIGAFHVGFADLQGAAAAVANEDAGPSCRTSQSARSIHRLAFEVYEMRWNSFVEIAEKKK
jgi:hypothetical protein